MLHKAPTIMAQQVTRNVLAIIGTGGMGMAIARRLGSGRRLLLGDYSKIQLETALTTLQGEGYTVEGCEVDVSDRDSVQKMAQLAASTGRIDVIVHTAGVSPVSSTAKQIYEIDLLGTAHVIDEFYPVVSSGTSLVCISSMAGYFATLSPELERHLATAPTKELLNYKEIDTASNDTGAAYTMAKRGNHLRVQAAAHIWGSKGARVNSISPGVISTPMGAAEFQGPSGAYMQAMIGLSGARRVGTPDDIAGAVAFLAGQGSSFITGNDILVDGGTVSAQRWNARQGDQRKE
jgi:NAD(P)-dependent dehydrogenase (short-subunit alcohol dehydrogenase family)